MPVHPKVRRCIHTKIDGDPCGAPAKKGKTYCRFHHHTRHMPPRFMLPPLEDSNSIQVTVMEVIRALLEDRMDRPKANTILYALQIAQSNLRGLNLVATPEELEDDDDGGSLADFLLKRLDQSAEDQEGEWMKKHGIPSEGKTGAAATPPLDPWDDPKFEHPEPE